MKTLVLALLMLVAPSGDVTGRWTGTVIVQDTGSGSEVSTPVEFQLQQKGDVITGKVGRKDDNDAAAVQNGKIDGDKVTLEAISPEILGPAKFTLVLKGNTLEGDMTVRIEEGKFEGKVKLVRTS